MINDSKLGVIGTLGTVVKQGAAAEVKKTVTNTIEQLSGNRKENKEKLAETSPQVSYLDQEKLKKESKETVDWLYGTTSQETPPAPIAAEKKPPARNAMQGVAGGETEAADAKQQLGLEQKSQNSANLVEQLGIAQKPQQSASLADHLGVGGAQLTPKEQAKQQQLKNRLHQDYYQRIRQDYHQSLNNPQKQSDTQERQKEAQEEQETQQQRMERMKMEDLQKKQEEEEKKKPVAVDMAQNMEKHRGSSG